MQHINTVFYNLQIIYVERDREQVFMDLVSISVVLRVFFFVVSLCPDLRTLERRELLQVCSICIPRFLHVCYLVVFCFPRHFLIQNTSSKTSHGNLNDCSDCSLT